MRKIKVIVKRPYEKIGHVTYISNTLENLQKIVGGKIEVVHTGISGLILILDEEGKLKKYQKNFLIGGRMFPDMVVGTAVLCGVSDDDFADVPINMAQWKIALELWGNDIR